MTVLDDTVLADPAALAALDSSGVLRSAATAGAQIRSTAQAAVEAGIGALAGSRPRAVVLVARPGTSTSATGILAALLGPACPVPVVVSELVPSWVGPLDVVLAHTAIGTDYELADAIDRAARRGAEVVLSAPGEGPVASAGAGRVRLVEPRVPVPPGLDLPRVLALGLSVLAQLGLLGADHGLGDDLGPVADVLDAEAERNQPGHEPFMNPAKALALRLADHTPLLWGTDAVAAAVAAHGGAGARHPRRAGRARRRGGRRGHRERPAAGAGRRRHRHLPRPVRRRRRRRRPGAAATGGAAGHRGG